MIPILKRWVARLRRIPPGTKPHQSTRKDAQAPIQSAQQTSGTGRSLHRDRANPGQVRQLEHRLDTRYPSGAASIGIGRADRRALRLRAISIG